MPQQGTQLVQFRGGDLLPRLEARADDRAGLGLIARRDLERYYSLVDDALAHLRTVLSRDESCAVMDACNGLYQDDAITPRYLWAEVADTEGLGAKWGVSEEMLVHKIRGLTPTEAMALADAIGRFWREPERDADEMLREVGLLA